MVAEAESRCAGIRGDPLAYHTLSNCGPEQHLDTYR